MNNLLQHGALIYVEDQDYLDNGVCETKEYKLSMQIFGRNGGLNRINYINFCIRSERLFISEFWTNPVNEGNGTKMMKCLFKFAEMKEVKTICGVLNCDDVADHGDRLLHFYKKHGFEIKYKNEIPYRIEKKLK